MHRNLSKQNYLDNTVDLLGRARRQGRALKGVGMYNWNLYKGGSGHHSASHLWSACNTQRSLQPGRLGQCTSLDIESGIRLASDRNSRGSTEYEQVRSRVTRSGHSAPHQVDTPGSMSGGANATVVASVASWADYWRWAQEDLPTISISNHWNKARRHDGYYNNTSYANAWYSESVARRTRKH